ncbi:MAG: response regulator transcription factor [Burkholderiaceae bacterium]
MVQWRVMIVEDNRQLSHFLGASVVACPQLSLVSSVASVAEARACLDQQASLIDVMLVDLGLPDGSGLDVIRLARELNPACEALVISMFGDEANVLASIEAGALGYIHKDAAPTDIANTILEMKAGASPISPMIARTVLNKYRGSSQSGELEPDNFVQPKTQDKGLSEIAQLAVPGVLPSRREREVLELVARGFSYGEIAQLQHISIHTVQTHIKHLYAKLSVHSRNEAVYEATRMGWLGAPD